MKSIQPGIFQPETIQNGLKTINKAFSRPNKTGCSLEKMLKKQALCSNNQPCEL